MEEKLAQESPVVQAAENTKWYVLRVVSGKERSVKEYLDKEAKQRTTNIKDATIRDSLDTNQIFKNISEQLGGNIGKVTVKKFAPESLKTLKPGALPLKEPDMTVTIDSLPKLIEKINQLNKGGKTDLRTIVDFLSIPKGATVKIDGKIIPFFDSDDTARTQNFKKSFHDAGMFYTFNTEKLLINKSFRTENTIAIEIDELCAHDIDNVNDWRLAELKYKLFFNEKI